MSAPDTIKSSSTYIAFNKVKLIRGGKAYFDLLEQIIGEAKDTIHLQVYIFDEDETGSRIAEALMAAAKRKVKVYLMADGYASQSISPAFIQRRICWLALSNAFTSLMFNDASFCSIFSSRQLYVRKSR